MDAFKLKNGLILTFEQSEEFNIMERKILVLPVLKWMLENLINDV